MRTRILLAAAAAAGACLLWIGASLAARQTVAFFPLQNLSDNSMAADVTRLGQALKELLQDRFDVRMIQGGDARDPAGIRSRARGAGAAYVLTGSVSKIGRTLTADLTLAATEDPGRSTTVVAYSVMEDGPAGARPAQDRIASEAAAKLKSAFFGEGTVGEGGGKRKIPGLAGTISRSRNLPGEVVSIAWGDTDRDGRADLVAAHGEGIAVYRMAADDPVEKARIPDAGIGIFHVDAADINRNGIAEILTARYAAGKAFSDIWEYDGGQYRRIARDIPYFLRAVDLGKEGIVLVGQESDPGAIHRGPVFRVALPGKGSPGKAEKGAPIPLPEGTWIYSFTTLKNGGSVRYAVLGGRDRLVLLDEDGKKLSESVESVSGTEAALDAPMEGSGAAEPAQPSKRLYPPSRLFGVDLQGDRVDELIVLNNLVTAGSFFENLRVYSNAEALCFAQEGDALRLAWRTPQVASSARDAFVDAPGGGKPLRIGIASLDKGKILGKFGEWRVLWMR
jgi:hypothetical protein